MKTGIFFLSLLLLFGVECVNAQRIIEGQVINEQNEPLSGVIVLSKGEQTGTRTDTSGFYKLNVRNNAEFLLFAFPGMNTVEVEIKKQRSINVTMVYEILEVKKEEYRLQKMGVVQVSSAYDMRMKSSPVLIGGGNVLEHNTENYSTIHEHGFKGTLNDPLSTFSIDVDRASYANIRRFINMGQMPPIDAVRIEEMINYFNYDYTTPYENRPIKVNTEYGECPWNSQHKMVLIGIQGKKIETELLPPSNLVFLLDVSGSMKSPNKLPLVKSSLRMLINELRPQDKVAIVVYAGAAGLVLESTPGSNKQKIIEAIDQLESGGSTAGGQGLQLAYKVASENFIPNGNNRIVLASDGDFNVGQSSDAEMERLVELQRDNGVSITVLGFGIGNIKDNKLEIIADKGNGNYAYIDNSQEARKIFIREFGGTLFTIAKDVKIQVEFNPQKVKGYRLIGYENRVLNNEDFNNDRKDAGEMGSGHQVTALYEIIPAVSSEKIPSVDDLKYQKSKPSSEAMSSDEILTVKVRYKLPDENQSNLIIETLLTTKVNTLNNQNNLKFAAAIAQFGMLLRDSEFKGTSTLENTIDLARLSKGTDRDGYCAEMIRLMQTARSLGL